MSSTTNHLEQINPVQRGLLLVAASAILWSSGGLIVRLLDNTDVWTVVFWRSAFACVFLLVFIALRDK
ncbi:MAG: EamA family transporter, partial [Candidatus Competibacteraceae bacterium]|nr:EamA family transporter [Candidatus Competibacteraceae bacterium]